MTANGIVTLMGLPRTGKSTYLGALWMIIQDDRATEVREIDIHGDRAYLQRLGEQVARLETVERTEVDSDDGLELLLELESVGEISLRVPDLSGETLRLLVEERTWHELLEQAIADSNALLLFVHPNKLRFPTRSNLADGVLAEYLSKSDGDDSPDEDSAPPASDQVVEASDDGSASEEPGAPIPEFSPRLAATAAKLIDAIENIVDTRALADRLKVGVIVSAWDEVVSAWDEQDGDPTPLGWMKRRLPAVLNVLEANDDRLDVAVFGVSAIGGRLPDDRDKLKALGSVLDRARALDAHGAPVPFVRPIEWALT